MNLSASELAELRADFDEHTYSDVLTIMRRATAARPSTQADVVVATGIPCRLGSLKQSGEIVEGGQVKPKTLYQVFTPFDSVEATAGMYLIITSQNNKIIHISDVERISQQFAIVYKGWSN